MIELIPAIDIIEGKCVRLTKGDYATRKTYDGTPADLAKAFEDYGFRRLHVVDLDGAKSKHVVNHRVLEEIATKTSLVVDFGGGIKSDDDLHCAFDHGAALVTVGTLSVESPEVCLRWVDKYGPSRFILGADVKEKKICTHGWKHESEVSLDDFLRYYEERGVRQVLCTDISHDGTLQGPALPLYREMLATHPDCRLIASGGVAGIDDFYALDEARVPAVVFGKAIYEGKLDLSEVSRRFLQ